MSNETGGPAFPVQDASKWQAHGMTLRDYFAAHAPQEPHAWFRPVMPNPCPEHKWEGRHAQTGEPLYFLNSYAAQKACGDDFWDANEEARAEWCAEFSKQNLVQWPYAWADAMLKARQE